MGDIRTLASVDIEREDKGKQTPYRPKMATVLKMAKTVRKLN